MLTFYAVFLAVITIIFWRFVRHRLINILFGLMNIYGGITGIFFQRIAGKNNSILFEGSDATIIGCVSLVSGVIILTNAFRRTRETTSD